MFDVTSIKSLDVFSFDKKGEQTGLGLVINGIPYLLWTHVYQNLEMTNPHSVSLLSRLESGKHYISFKSSEMNEIKGRYNVTLYPGFNSSIYHFITQEGFNRIIMDVDTFRMKDKTIAANIEARKNKMAKVFTQYETGTLKFPAPKNNRAKTLPGGYPAVSPIFKDRKALGKGIGLDEHTAVMMALQETEELTGVCLNQYRSLVPQVVERSSDKRFSSSVVADKFGVSRVRCNQFLADNFLLEPFGKDWVLTDLGKKFGVMKPTTVISDGKTAVKYSPRWSPEVVLYLKKNNPVKGQKQLI